MPRMLSAAEMAAYYAGHIDQYGTGDPDAFPFNALPPYSEDMVFSGKGTQADGSIENYVELPNPPGAVSTVAPSGFDNPVSYATYNFNAGVPQVLSQNRKRCFLLIQNNGAAAIYVGFGVLPSAGTSLSIAAGLGIIFDEEPPNNAITILCAAGGSGIIVEGTKP